MLKLFVDVIEWVEKLVYTGTKDDALPPKVLKALDAYLGESNSKVLVVLPLQDEREKELKKKARSALMMECFETNLPPEQLLARLEVVGRHASSALYNAQEYRHIPMRFLWLPLAYVQDGMGGKAKAITYACIAGAAALIVALILVPFPLKMEANGPAEPKDRSQIFSPIPGKVEDIPLGLKSGSKVYKGQTLFVMFDFDLQKQVRELQTDITNLEARIKAPPAKAGESNDRNDPIAVQEATNTRRSKIDLLNRLRERVNADLANPGKFKITAPRTGIILSADFRQDLSGKYVRPNEPLLRIGATDPDNPKLADWELEVKIPQKHIGQVLRAYESLPPRSELDVDVLFMARTEAGRFRGKLRKDRIAALAEPQKDENNNDSEPMVKAWVRIDGDDIPADMRITPSLLLTGSDVHTRIRCGNHPMGYSLFYGVYEFAYEKVIFPLSWK